MSKKLRNELVLSVFISLSLLVLVSLGIIAGLSIFIIEYIHWVIKTSIGVSSITATLFYLNGAKEMWKGVREIYLIIKYKED